MKKLKTLTALAILIVCAAVTGCTHTSGPGVVAGKQHDPERRISYKQMAGERIECRVPEGFWLIVDQDDGQMASAFVSPAQFKSTRVGDRIAQTQPYWGVPYHAPLK